MESHKNLSVPKHQHQPVIYISTASTSYIYIYQHHQPVIYIYLLMDSSPNHLRIMWTSTERPTGPRNGPTHRLWCRDVEKSCREVLRALNEGCVTRIHLPRPQKKGPKIGKSMEIPMEIPMCFPCCSSGCLCFLLGNRWNSPVFKRLEKIKAVVFRGSDVSGFGS